MDGRHAWAWRTTLLLLWFFAGALLFCTSMLSTSTLMPQTATDICGGIDPVDQVVVILIDAMRPDFALPRLRCFAQHGGDCTGGDALVEQYDAEVGDTLTYIEESLRDVHRLSQGYFLVADAPTTTAQRIKAIATGTMPAFLEAGSNFNSEATELDSFVRQAQGRAVILGDDTWTKLFPNDDNDDISSGETTNQNSSSTTASGTSDAQGSTVPRRRHWKSMVDIPSFDVADFHTNDDAVLGSIYDVLARETKEYAHAHANGEAHAKVVIGHFLGVDHIGHRLNADNPTMHSKLRQLNQMLRNVTQLLRERPTGMRTMMLVLGDHGMTNSGDHGGESVQETDTFLYAEYFPGQGRDGQPAAGTDTQQRRSRQHADALCRSRWAHKDDPDLHRLQSCQQASGIRDTKLGAAYQVDITSTITALIGRPIPFSNFGRVLSEVIALADADADVARVEQCNAKQFHTYAEAAGMPPQRYDSLTTAAGKGSDSDERELRRQLAAFSYYARKTRSVMNRRGMFVGSWMVLVAALSLLWIGDVQRCLIPGNGVENWTMFVVVGRLVTVFSNSFVTNEDTELFTLLSSLVWITTTASGSWWGASSGVPSRRRRFWRTLVLGVAFIVFRQVAPYAYRHRFPITHAVESTSSMEQWVSQWPVPERIGPVAGGVLCVIVYCRRSLASCVLMLVTVLVLCACYKVPRWHHVAPFVLASLYTLWGWFTARGNRVAAVPRAAAVSPMIEPALYRFLVWVLWCSTLCNEGVVAAAVIAIYGCALPLFIRVMRRSSPDTSVAVQLHLLSYVVFFLQGHQCMLSTIDWNSSFVGMSSYSLVGGGVLVLSRTFNAFLFVPVACALQDSWADEATERETDDVAGTRPPKHGRRHRCAARLRHYVLHVVVLQAAVACFNGYIQKSHLMLYPIFCPKYLFDVVIALMTGAGVLLSLL